MTGTNELRQRLRCRHAWKKSEGVGVTKDEAAADASQPTFETLMAQVMTTAQRFGHREHVHLTWLAVRSCGTRRAIALVSEGIQRTARYAGAPQKYHATVSRAWVELVGHHVEGHAGADTSADPSADFEAFVGHNAALLDKRLLTRFYRSATLAAEPARDGWVEPDLAPFSWQALPGPGASS
jgi:hypothetical protein